MDDPVKRRWPSPWFEAVPEDGLGGLVVGAHPAGVVEEDDPLAQRGDHGLVALLGGPAAGLGLACVGQLGDHDHPAGGEGVVVDERVDRHQHVDGGAVLATVAALAALDQGRAVGAVGGDHRADGVPGHLLLGPSVDDLGGLVPALDAAVGVDADDGVRDVGHQAGPVAGGGLGGPALRHVAQDGLVGRLAAPGGADAGELHVGHGAVGADGTDLAVLEELAGLGQAGQALDHAVDVVGVDPVGDRLAVVVPHGLHVEELERGPVAVDEEAVLVDDHHVGGDLGQEAVAVDQVAELGLVLLLGGDVDDHTAVEGGGRSGRARSGRGEARMTATRVVPSGQVTV